MTIIVEKAKSKKGKLYVRAYYESEYNGRTFQNHITFDRWFIINLIGGAMRYRTLKEGDKIFIATAESYSTSEVDGEDDIMLP